MNDKDRFELTKNTADTLNSLNDSIRKVGGNIPYERLMNMTLLEFISHVCAPNGVRFTIVQTKPVEEDEKCNDAENVVQHLEKCPKCHQVIHPHKTHNSSKWKYECSNCCVLFGAKEHWYPSTDEYDNFNNCLRAKELYNES